MAGFGDLDTAAKFRDTIERIVVGQIRRERPLPRVGKVYSYDSTASTAQILFSGESLASLVKVNVPSNLIPQVFLEDTYPTSGLSGSADIVRVEGSPGSYYISGFVFGIPQGVPAAGSEPLHAYGVAGQYWDGTKTWVTLNVAAVAGLTAALAGKEPTVTAGTTAQYYRGDKTWQTLNPAAVGAEPTITAGTTAQYWRGDKSWQTLNATAVGLGNVANVLQYSASNLPAFTNITGVTTLAQMPAAGTSAQYMRGDKTWQTLNAAAAGAEPTITGGTTLQYWRGDKSWQTLDKTAVGLANVLNIVQEPAITAGTTLQYWRGDKTWATLNSAAVGAEPAITAGTTAQYWRGDKSWQTLNATAVGLGNVANLAQVDLVNNQTVGGNKTFTGTVQFNSTVVGITPAMVGALPDPGAPGTGFYFRGDKTWATLNIAAVPNLQTTLDNKVDLSNNQTVAGQKSFINTQTIFTNPIDQLTTPLDTTSTQTYLKNLIGYAGITFESDKGTTAADKGILSYTTLGVFQLTKSTTTSGATKADLFAGALWDTNQRVYSASNKPTFANIDPASVLALSQLPAGGTSAQYMRGDKTWQTLNPTAVGLGNVPNVDATNATNISTGTLAPARMGSGSPSSANFLRGDGTWTAVPSGGEPIITAGTTAQYWRGDKTWQTLSFAAVSGSVADVQLPVRLQDGAAHLITDANNGNSSGFYYLSSGTNGPAGTGDSGQLLVVAYSSSYIIQRFNYFNSTITYTRVCNAGAWGGWFQGTDKTTSDSAYNAFITAGTTAQYWRGDKTWQTLDKTAVGLANVLNVAQEPAITAGTSAQYWRGDKTWQTLNAAAVGITTDAAVGTGSLRTIGTGALQAAAGNHTHTQSGITDFYAIGYRQSTAQTVAAATLTTVGLASATLYSYGSNWTNTSNIINITNAGLYRFEANIAYPAFSTTARVLLRIETWTGVDPGIGSGTIIAEVEHTAVAAIFPALHCSGVFPVIANQKVRLYTFHGNSASLNIGTTSEPNRLDIMKMAN